MLELCYSDAIEFFDPIIISVTFLRYFDVLLKKKTNLSSSENKPASLVA